MAGSGYFFFGIVECPQIVIAAKWSLRPLKMKESPLSLAPLAAIFTMYNEQTHIVVFQSYNGIYWTSVLPK